MLGHHDRARLPEAVAELGVLAQVEVGVHPSGGLVQVAPHTAAAPT
ncbi:hypothetical protein HFP72_00365 [Nocardiopsis sp. ARC36]